ncbi:MAG: hypothetical protein ACYS0I_03905 [Planctomycetota bacterium]
MKVSCKVTVVVMMAAMVLFSALACGAEEEKEEKIWRDEGPGHRREMHKLTDEAIEHVMERLREAMPERAEELEKLREKDPEQFKAELREIMREHFAERFREGRERGERGGLHEGRRDRERDMVREHMDEMRERFVELLEWLEKNYPEKAAELAELKEKEPELYRRQLWLSWRQYRRIAEAERENPQLAEVLKQDLELKKKREKTLSKIEDASEDEKKELVADLEEIVSSQRK